MKQLDILSIKNLSHKKLHKIFFSCQHKIKHMLFSKKNINSDFFLIRFRACPRLIPFFIWRFFITRIIDLKIHV